MKCTKIMQAVFWYHPSHVILRYVAIVTPDSFEEKCRKCIPSSVIREETDFEKKLLSM